MNVMYSAAALYDIKTIYEYIAYELVEEQTAKKMAGLIMDAAETLSSLPERGALCEYEPWRSRGVRFLTVKKYLLFYLIDDANDNVEIVRIMYGGRDIHNLAKDVRNAEYIDKIDRSFAELKAGRGIVKTMEELEAMENE